MCPYPRMILLKAHQCELVDTNNKLLSLNDRGRQSFSEVEKVASLTTGWERSSWGTKKKAFQDLYQERRRGDHSLHHFEHFTKDKKLRNRRDYGTHPSGITMST